MAFLLHHVRGHYLRAKHLIKLSRVLGIAVTDEELGLSQLILHRKVACLLRYPAGAWMGGDPGQVHSVGRDLNEEENIERF